MPSVEFSEEYYPDGRLKSHKISISTTPVEDVINGVNELVNRTTGQNNPPIYQIPIPNTSRIKRISGS